MSISFKKILLTGTALVAVAAFSAPARATTQTLAADAIWAGTGGATGADILNALTCDSVNLNGNILTVTNNQTANDDICGCALDTFTIGGIADTLGVGSVEIIQDAGGTVNPLAVTITSVNLVAASNNFSVENDATDTADQDVTVDVSGAFTLGGDLMITNGDGDSGDTITMTIGDGVGTDNTTVGGGTTITGGNFAGADTTLILNGKTNTFTGGVTLDDSTGSAIISFTGSGAQSVTGTIDGDVAGEGTLYLNNAAAGTGVTFNSAIGGGAALGAIDFASANTTVFNSTVNADEILFGSAATANFNGDVTTAIGIDLSGFSGVINFGDNADLTGNLNSTTAGFGTVNFLGTSTVGGGVLGALGDELAEINGGAAGETVTINSSVAATNINVTGTGTLEFNADVIGALNFSGGNGTIVAGDGVTITGDITTTTDNTGILELADTGGGTVIDGLVGAAGSALNAVNVTGAAGDVTFNKAVVASDIDLGGSAATAATFKDDVTGDVNFSADGTMVADGAITVTGDITAAVTGEGTINVVDFAGTTSFDGNIGTSGKNIGVLNIAGAAANTVTTTGNLYVKAITANAADTLEFIGTAA
ncbi:MAG: hypothetical protein K8R48_01495, partial [Alphaproteobacteria bacterium]|nr:hypothetical protein [Alphaproteobacteria bacterium]